MSQSESTATLRNISGDVEIGYVSVKFVLASTVNPVRASISEAKWKLRNVAIGDISSWLFWLKYRPSTFACMDGQYGLQMREHHDSNWYASNWNVSGTVSFRDRDHVRRKQLRKRKYTMVLQLPNFFRLLRVIIAELILGCYRNYWCWERLTLATILLPWIHAQSSFKSDADGLWSTSSLDKPVQISSRTWIESSQ